ncbi:MAG: ABC transporter substrate-binding protein, partial [Bryobacteraceae bacterium]
VLSAAMKNITVEASGAALMFDSPVGRPGLLEELANPRYAIYKRTAEIPLVGTGPFRLNPWLPGAPVMLAAFEEHWAGRPYLDAMHFDTRHSAVPDLIELPVNTNPRTLSEKLRIETSPPVELFAVILPAGSPPQLSEALSLAIDRAAIVNVLFQRRGEPTAALLPQWLSGYAFLFPAEMDLNHARTLAAEIRVTIPQPLTLSYPAGDSVARGVADRIAVNVRDAGLVAQSTTGPGQARLVRVPIASSNPAQALAGIAAGWGEAEPAGEPYEAERGLIEKGRIVPIAHVPRVYGVHARVRDYVPGGRLENVWVAP